jgi:hypothetical protein
MPRGIFGGGDAVGGRGTGRGSGTPGTVPTNAMPSFPAGPTDTPAAAPGYSPANFGSPGERKEAFMLRFKQRFPGLFGR